VTTSGKKFGIIKRVNRRAEKSWLGFLDDLTGCGELGLSVRPNRVGFPHVFFVSRPRFVFRCVEFLLAKRGYPGLHFFFCRVLLHVGREGFPPRAEMLIEQST
jgi:hypothetical protein